MRRSVYSRSASEGAGGRSIPKSSEAVRASRTREQRCKRVYSQRPEVRLKGDDEVSIEQGLNVCVRTVDTFASTREWGRVVARKANV